MPLFYDKKTKPINITPENVMFPDELSEPMMEEFIHLDAMGFGMGCCCLQITFQARDIQEARRLYDQLAVICPIVVLVGCSVMYYMIDVIDGIDTNI